MKNVLRVLFSFLILLFLTGGDLAAVTDWQVGVGDWYAASSWTNGVPTSNDAARIINGGTAQIVAVDSNASAAALDVGYTASAGARDGAVIMSNGMLKVSGALQLGYSDWVPVNHVGSFTQDGGTATVGNLYLYNGSSFYRIRSGSLTIAGGVIMPNCDSGAATRFYHEGGNVYVTNNLQIGHGYGSARFIMNTNAGILNVANISFADSGVALDMRGGTLIVRSTINGSATPYGIDLSGGTATCANLYFSDRYNSAAIVCDQHGADVQVTGNLEVRGTNAVYKLRKGKLQIGTELRLGEGDQYGASAGDFWFNIAATGPTVLTDNGGAAKLRAGYHSGIDSLIGKRVGTFRGWGDVDLHGTLDNSARILADGQGTDRTLDMSHFSNVVNSIENTTSFLTTGTGWFVQDHGKLLLPSLSNLTAGMSINWGEAANDANIDLVNSLRLSLGSGVVGGSLSIALLATNRTDVDIRSSKVIGLWQVDGTAFDFGGGTATLTVRYNDALCAINVLDIPQDTLKLWRFTGQRWMDITASVNTNINVKQITSLPFSAFNLFAVSPDSPNPVAPGLMILVM